MNPRACLAVIVAGLMAHSPAMAAAPRATLEFLAGAGYSPTRYPAMGGDWRVGSDMNGAIQVNCAVLMRLGNVAAIGVSIAHWRYTDQGAIGRAYFTPISAVLRGYVPLRPASPYLGLAPALVLSDWSSPAKYQHGLLFEAGVRVRLAPHLGLDLGINHIVSDGSELFVSDASPLRFSGLDATWLRAQVSVRTSAD